MSVERFQRVAIRVCILVTITVAFLVAVELAAFGYLRWSARRLLERTDPHAQLSVYRSEPWAAAYWREHQIVHRPPEYHAYVVWRRPEFTGTTIVIDRDGIRRTHHSHCDDPRAYTVYVFGGSALWGYGSPDWATIPSLLAERYEAERPACVVNYGETAWVSTQNVIELVRQLTKSARKPDLVIFYDGCNEIVIPYSTGRPDVHSNFNEIKSWLERRGQAGEGSFGYLTLANTRGLAARIAARLKTVSADSLFTGDVDHLAREIARGYLANLDVVEGLARRYGFAYAAFWQPVAVLGHKILTEEERTLMGEMTGEGSRLGRALHEKTHALVRASGHSHLRDFTGVFDDRRESVYITPCHVSPAGNRIVAARMYEAVRGAPRESR